MRIQKRKVYGNVGADQVILANLKKKDGTLVGTGDTVTVKVYQDFGAFEELEIGGATIYDPERGTVENPDERWIPGQHNNEGFNAEYVVDGENLDQIGRYKAIFEHDGLKTTFEINIAS